MSQQRLHSVLVAASGGNHERCVAIQLAGAIHCQAARLQGRWTKD